MTAHAETRVPRHVAERSTGRTRVLWAAAVFGVYAAATLLYIALGRGAPVPQLYPDEQLYSALAHSVAAGDGLAWRGAPVDLKSSLWVYLITPAWLLTDGQVSAYALAKVIAATVGCLVVFPTWFLARRFLPAPLALAAAALAVGGSWMTHAAAVLTENAALPATVASLMALVFALMQPGSRWGWGALAFAGLAAWARLQLGVLVPVIFISLLAAAAFEGPNAWRVRLSQDRWLTALTGMLSIVGALAVLVDSSLLGFYGTVSDSLSLSGVPGAIGKELLAFIAMTGFVPFLLVVAVSVDREAWRDADLRALLIVSWIATASIVLVTGMTLPRLFGVTWSIQRYVEYSLPLFFVAALCGPLRVRVKTIQLATITLVVSVGFLFQPAIFNIQEQRALFGITHRLGEPLGLSGATSLALACLLCGGVLVLLAILRDRRTISGSGLVTGALVATAFVILVQDQAGWSYQRSQASGWRANFPAQLDWIDRSAPAPVARLVGAVNPFRYAVTDYFNDHVTQVYVPDGAVVPGPAIQGKTCTWKLSSAGVPQFSNGCGPPPRVFLLNDDQAKFTFYNQRVLADNGDSGRVVRVRPEGLAQPRLRALVTPPCSAPIGSADPRTGKINPPGASCSNAARIQLWLDKPGKVVVRYKGGTGPQILSVQSTENPQTKQHPIDSGTTTDVTIPAGTGAQQILMQGDWEGGALSPDIPQLESVELVQGDQTQQLLY